MLTEVENVINQFFGDFKAFEEEDKAEDRNTYIQEQHLLKKYNRMKAAEEKLIREK